MALAFSSSTPISVATSGKAGRFAGSCAHLWDTRCTQSQQCTEGRRTVWESSALCVCAACWRSHPLEQSFEVVRPAARERRAEAFLTDVLRAKRDEGGV